MLTVITGGRTDVPPHDHHRHLLQAVHDIERLVATGFLGYSRTLAYKFSPIERAYVTEKMLRDGFDVALVAKVLLP
ncbi:hypothetical protein [Azoarcus sp. KH32C]|uniref:hypothetical protein n=1 Tax=Azoarcus sp. KH32C TaxID=748247 RepID=UPI00059FA3C1|nr:hypothetical protein [Azoarcus sp. KH32C]